MTQSVMIQVILNDGSGSALAGASAPSFIVASSLSDLKNRSEKVTGRGQILRILKANSYSIGRKSGEI